MPSVVERHFRVSELAGFWRLSPSTISRLFRDEPGVLKLGTRNRRYKKRPYLTLSIPESIAAKVKSRLEAGLQ